jgi:GrpB-like predicted nucleotidyltransferase (UPF0157 family)
METVAEKVRRLMAEDVAVEVYDPRWPEWFLQEAAHLRACLPPEMIGRIAHFGSTAVPGLAAKPIIDMLVEVNSLEETKQRIVPILTAQGYDYLWRPTWGGDIPPFYAWFIKRNAAGKRTHHLHMIEKDFAHWNRLLFCDYLAAHPEEAHEYGRIKQELAVRYPRDRVAYSAGKSAFIERIMRLAGYRGALPV